MPKWWETVSSVPSKRPVQNRHVLNGRCTSLLEIFESSVSISLADKNGKKKEPQIELVLHCPLMNPF